jgi:lysozyme
MTRLSRRDFLRTAAGTAAGAGAVGVLGSPAARADGPDYAIQGIDVSFWQGPINWYNVRASGKLFAFCRATRGLDYSDPTFAFNYAQARANGILRGAYHYGFVTEDAIQQATKFIDTVQPKKGDLKPVLDLEDPDGVAMQPAELRAWVQEFVGRVVELLGQTPIIYTGYYYWRDEVVGADLNLGCPLWVPNYSAPAPLVPAPWANWSFWQYSNTGSVPGISGNVDLDAFRTTKTDLNRLRLT